MKNNITNMKYRHEKTTDILCDLYDDLIANTAEPGSGFDFEAAHYSAYGALNDGYASEITLSFAFCYYAQELGLPCTAVRGRANGNGESDVFWCKVKIDGVWYNAAPYMDKNNMHNNPVRSMTIDTSSIKNYHTYFLTNDEFMSYMGFYLPEESKGLPAANSKQANYYIETDENYYFYYKYEDLDKCYEEIVSWAAQRFKNGKSTSSIYVAPWLVDDLWKKVKPNIIPDLIDDYGIKSDIKVNCAYMPDHFISTLS